MQRNVSSCKYISYLTVLLFEKLQVRLVVKYKFFAIKRNCHVLDRLFSPVNYKTQINLWIYGFSCYFYGVDECTIILFTELLLTMPLRCSSHNNPATKTLKIKVCLHYRKTPKM